MNPKTRCPDNLAMALAVSLTLHAALAFTDPHTAGSKETGPLRATVATMPVTLSRFPDAPAKALSRSAPAREPGATDLAATARDGHLAGERTLGGHEPPMLLAADEIDLQDLQDLTEEGYVELELLITPEGRFAKATPVETDLPAEFFDRVAHILQSAEFAPGTANGAPVVARLRLRVVFSRTTLL